MKVQRIKTEAGKRYILIDNDYKPLHVINSYLKYLDIIGCSPNTLKTYAYQIKEFLIYLSGINLNYDEIFTIEKIGPFEIMVNYIQYLKMSNSIKFNTPKTINAKVNTIFLLYNFLSKNYPVMKIDNREKTNFNFSSFKPFLAGIGIYKKDNFRNILKIKNSEEFEEFKIIEREEYYKIYHACNSKRDKLIIALLFENGLRIGEVLGIQFEDIILEDNALNIVSRDNNENDSRVKNKAEGTVWFPEYVARLLTNYITSEINDYKSNFLFINLDGGNKGKPIMYSTIYQLFIHLSNKTGIKVRPHMLRHGYATEKRKAGFDLIEIKEDLRHKNIYTTQKYTHLSVQDRREKMKKFLNQNNHFFERLKEDE